MFSIVLDSNIYISAFLFKGNQRKIIEDAIKGKFTVNISYKILAEIESVLKRPKFKLSPNHISLFIDEIGKLTEICNPSERIINVCRDSKDHIILECAVESQSDYIVTGDKDLLIINEFRKIKIISSDEFIKMVDEDAINT